MCLMLEAESLEDLLARINVELPKLFRFDCASLCLSLTRGKLFQSEHGHCYWMTPASMGNAMMGRETALVAHADIEARLFGSRALDVNSVAMVHLNLSKLGLSGILALGSKTAGFVSDEDSDDILRFLGLIVERTVQLWVLIDLANQS